MSFCEMSQSSHYLSTALDNSARKSQKSKNSNGNPIRLPSKILAIIKDENGLDGFPAVFVAEAAGCVKRISLQVCKIFKLPF
jgi:hypothetical protein